MRVIMPGHGRAAHRARHCKTASP